MPTIILFLVLANSGYHADRTWNPNPAWLAYCGVVVLGRTVVVEQAQIRRIVLARAVIHELISTPFPSGCETLLSNDLPMPIMPPYTQFALFSLSPSTRLSMPSLFYTLVSRTCGDCNTYRVVYSIHHSCQGFGLASLSGLVQPNKPCQAYASFMRSYQARSSIEISQSLQR